MLTVHWEHNILAAIGYSGTSRRIARMRAAGASFPHPYRDGPWSGITWSPTTDEAGRAPDSYTSPPLPLELYGDRTYVFAFWSANGSSSTGGTLRLIHDGPTPSIGVGEEQWTLNPKAWYVWDRNSGGGGDGVWEHGVEIDAFNCTSNDFMPDYFVDISPDGSPDPARDNVGPLTYTANEDGYISTENLTEPITIKARGQFRDAFSHFQFSHWQVIHRFTGGSPMPEVNGHTITIHPQNTMKAYAVYDQIASDGFGVEEVQDIHPFVLVTDRAGLPVVIVDPFGGIRPVPPRGPDDLRQIIEMLHRMENDLRKRYKF